LTDEETVEPIREDPYLQFFLGFAGYSTKAPFDPLMMVHFRERFSEEDLNRIDKMIAERGKATSIEAVSTLSNEDESGDPGRRCWQPALTRPTSSGLLIGQKARTGERSTSMLLVHQQTSPIQQI
jgi:hypothetical protein